MKKLLLLLALIAIPFSAHAQTPGAQPEFCVTSPSQTANYNQTCISASASGGAVQVNNFGTATGGLGVGTIASGIWNGSPITNPFISTPFVTVNGTTCTLGASCTIASPSAGLIIGSSTITSGTTNQLLYDNAGVVGEVTKGNSCLYGTNGAGVPTCLTTLPSTLSATSWTMPSLTVTGSFTATGLVTNADLVNTVITVNTVACTLGSSCSISAAASLVVGSTTVSSGTTNQILYDNGGTLGEITKGNSCVYGTSGTGVPSCVTTLPFIVSLATGGTNANLTASTGGIAYSSASAIALLAGTATASLPLLSGASAAPTWATISYPTSANSGGVPYFSSATVISSSGALGANCIVYGGGAGTSPATSATNCPQVSNAGAITTTNSFTTTLANAASMVSLSGATNAFSIMGVGRTGLEFNFGVSGAVGNFFSQSVAGDAVVYTTGNLFIGFGNSSATKNMLFMLNNAVGTSLIGAELFASGGLFIGATPVDPGTQNLTVAGTIKVNGLPASAGAGGLFLCVDTSGNVYKKATCP